MLTTRDNELMKKYGIGLNGVSDSGTPLTLSDDEMIRAEAGEPLDAISTSREEKNAGGGFFSKVGKIVEKQGQGAIATARSATRAELAGEQTGLEAAAQAGAGILGAGGRVVGNIAIEGLKAITPDVIEEKFSKVADFATKELLLPIVKPWLELAQTAKTLHPAETERFQSNGKAIIDVLDALGAAEGGQVI